MVSSAQFLSLALRIPSSRANGPGERAVIWVQGCSLACPGCYNPHTHPFGQGERVSVPSLTGWLRGLPPSLEGLTISGGEPFQQAPALSAFLAVVRAQTRLSILVFSGYELAELAALQSASSALAQIDVLIAGRYQAGKRLASGLVGSANKTTHFLTSRYSPADLLAIPDAEAWIEPDGQILLSGINPLTWPNQ